MSDETVELIRKLHPGPGIELVALFATDDPAARAETFERFFDAAFECALRFPGSEPTFYSGPDALRDCWLEWLAPWASYRFEIEELIDLDERIVVVARDYGRHEPDGPEIEQRDLGIWTLSNGRILRAEFFANRTEGLAAAGLAQ
jgi:ketosteroid isomerase-like protein